MKTDAQTLDAELLLAHVLNVPRAYLFAHPERTLSTAETRVFFVLLHRRLQGEPIAYIMGTKEFYGRTFLVNKNVLIPRPDSETIIDAVKARHTPHEKLWFWDVGTGSGALAITLAKEFPHSRVWASDVSRSALSMAKKNARCFDAKIKFFLADTVILPPSMSSMPSMSASSSSPPLILIANLPYLSPARFRRLPSDIKNFEPRMALVAGDDGLKSYRRLFASLKKNASIEHALTELYLEADPEQLPKIKKMAAAHWPNAATTVAKDLAGRRRVLIIQKPALPQST